MTTFDPKKVCGVLPSPDGPAVLTLIGGLTDAEPDPVTRYRFCIPSDSQGNYPACAGYATVNAFENAIKEVDPSAFADKWQLDGLKLWREAREDFYNGNMDGGLQLEEAFTAGLKRGLFPDNTFAEPVGATPMEVCYALQTGALIQGTNVHQGWARPHPESGCIPSGYIPNLFAGHATCIVSAFTQGDKWFIGFQNSWLDWGRYGYGVMSWSQWQMCLMQPPLLLLLPEGWQKHDGWKKYLTKREAA
jgi:hypothetical protein